MLIARIELAFTALANPGLALRMRAYQRDQFAFLGIPTPARRAAIAALGPHRHAQSELLQLASTLWRMPYREYQYAAIDLLASQKKMLGADAIPPLLDLAQRQPWWETVDGLAPVIGHIVRADRAAQGAMDAALVHPSMWVRRIAMTHQLGWRLQTDRERLFHYALTLAPETEFFIRKAIGWALRDYAKWQPEAVLAFVLAQRQQFSALTLREALKHQQAALQDGAAPRGQ